MSYTKKFHYAAQPSTERGRAIQLAADPKGETFLYCNGRTVIMRNLKNPEIATEYTGHTCAATVARYAPTGYYIASGDVQGNIRIWDTLGTEQILKTETKIFSGKVNDLDWDFESKRIIGVGEGKDRFGHAFMFDTASSTGEISGHSKGINSVSIRPGRPLRAVTGSDDFTVNFYHGAPFKFNRSHKEHSRFVQCVRFSGTGDHFISTGSDSKIFLYDGKTGDPLGELSTAEGTHTGGVYSLSWSPDSTQFLTGSGDMTAKLWDVTAKKVVQTYSFSDSPTFEHQQVGTLWKGSHLISVSLSGDINYLDPRTSGKPVRVIKGHQKGITTLTLSSDKKLYSGSYDGRICSWEEGTGGAVEVTGQGHSNQVVTLGSGDEKVFSCGMDDSFRSLSISDKKFDTNVVPTGAIPKSMSVNGTTACVVTGANEVFLVKDGKKENSFKVPYSPTACAFSPDQKSIAVGAEDGKIHIHSTSDFKETSLLENNRGQVTCLAYSPNGEYLAAGDADRKVLVYDTATKTLKFDQFVFHSARINSVSWSPDGLHLVSGSLDNNVEVWSVEKPMKHISIKVAHLDSVTGTVFVDNNTIATSGADASIKIFSLVHH
ncbi:WD40-repeat-containing domain protein [Globomyces pollinis-pini]|nr:WD40-repeat-containing domain protein [Globomyces pollinis-pini]